MAEPKDTKLDLAMRLHREGSGGGMVDALLRALDEGERRGWRAGAEACAEAIRGDCHDGPYAKRVCLKIAQEGPSDE